MQKIVINTCFGGFNLSQKAIEAYADRKGIPADEVYTYELLRDDAVLVDIVETMGDAAGGQFSRLKVVTIPADVQWQIDEYDGAEHVAEQHRTWY